MRRVNHALIHQLATVSEAKRNSRLKSVQLNQTRITSNAGDPRFGGQELGREAVQLTYP
jgi:hypothetical protein